MAVLLRAPSGPVLPRREAVVFPGDGHRNVAVAVNARCCVICDRPLRWRKTWWNWFLEPPPVCAPGDIEECRRLLDRKIERAVCDCDPIPPEFAGGRIYHDKACPAYWEAGR